MKKARDKDGPYREMGGLGHWAQSLADDFSALGPDGGAFTQVVAITCTWDGPPFTDSGNYMFKGSRILVSCPIASQPACRCMAA